MELGQRLKEARLEKGLSQRQLCGDVITRNMLSQIENGSARPSMDTLRYLAGVLGKPMGYFLEQEAVTSPNRDVMEQARVCFGLQKWEEALEKLQAYQQPDPVFDWEKGLLSAIARMALAEQVLQVGKAAYAETLLEQAGKEGTQTPYYTRQDEHRRLCLLYLTRPDRAQELAARLPADPHRTLLLAAAEPERAGLILDAAPQEDPRWHFMRAEAYFRDQNYARAITHYEKAPQDRQTIQRLESCCKELEDYKTAYYYACKLREY